MSPRRRPSRVQVNVTHANLRRFLRGLRPDAAYFTTPIGSMPLVAEQIRPADGAGITLSVVVVTRRGFGGATRIVAGVGVARSGERIDGRDPLRAGESTREELT